MTCTTNNIRVISNFTQDMTHALNQRPCQTLACMFEELMAFRLTLLCGVMFTETLTIKTDDRPYKLSGQSRPGSRCV